MSEDYRNIIKAKLEEDNRHASDKLTDNYVQEAQIWADAAIEGGYVTKAFEPYLQAFQKHGKLCATDRLDWFNTVYAIGRAGSEVVPAGEGFLERKSKLPFLGQTAAPLAVRILQDRGAILDTGDGKYTLPNCSITEPKPVKVKRRLPVRRLEEAVKC